MNSGRDAVLLRYPGLRSLPRDELAMQAGWLDQLDKRPAEELSEQERAMLEYGTGRSLGGTKAPPGDLQLKTLAQLRTETDSEIPWLVEDLLHRDGVSLLVAAPKVGKSTLARCLSASVASGDEWLGRQVMQGRVAHLALEETKATVVGHFEALDAPPDQTLQILVQTPLRPGHGVDRLASWMQTTHVSLVVIDPIVRLVQINDGNSYSETYGALAPIVDLARQYNVHIMGVHHSRKSGGEFGAEVLGSTALAASVDVIISVVRREKRRYVSAFGRDGVNVEETRLTMDRNGRIDVSETRRHESGRQLREKIVEFLRTNSDPMTKEDIRSALSVRSQAVVAALNDLVRSKELVRDGSGKRGNPYRHSLAIPTPRRTGNRSGGPPSG